METSILYEQDDDNVYVAELSRNIHENSEESESDDNNDYDIQDVQKNENTRGRAHGRGCNQNHEAVQLPSSSFFNTFQHLRLTHKFKSHLPTRYEHSLSSPYSIFSIFFHLNK